MEWFLFSTTDVFRSHRPSVLSGSRKLLIWRLVVLGLFIVSLSGCDSGVADDEFKALVLSADYSPTVEDVPKLITLIETGDHEMRLHVAGAIAELGPDAREALPMLAMALAEYGEGDKRGFELIWNGKRVPYKPPEHVYGHVEYDE